MRRDCNLVLQQAKAVVLRPTSSIVLHSSHSVLRSSSPSAVVNIQTVTSLPVSGVDSHRQTPLSPAFTARSPVHEADDRALFEIETPSSNDDDDRRHRAAVAETRDELDHGLVRRKRSDDSEFDNVDAFDIDEERLARVRIA